jgi:hypothetical protein
MDRFSSDVTIVLNFSLRQQDVLESTSFQFGLDFNPASDCAIKTTDHSYLSNNILNIQYNIIILNFV